jgi:hypothetical protein
VNIVIGLLGSSEEVFFSSLSAAILFFISFTIPNLIYFRRRKFLFGFSDEKTVEKIENECIEPIIETTLKEDNQPCFHENTIKTSKQKFCKLRARLIKAFKFLGIFTVLALAVTLIFAIPAINANVNEDREYIGERADDYGGKERLTLHTKTCAMLPFIENKESVTGEKAMEFYYLANHESVNTSFCHLCNPKKPSFKQLKKLSSDYSSEFQELSQHSEQWKKLVKYKTTIEYSDEYIKRIYKINPPPAALLDKNSDAWSRIKAEIEHSQRAAELKEEYQQIFDEIYNKKPFDTEITPENIRFAQEKINRMENIKRYANSLETKTRNGALLYAISTWLSIEA